MKRRDFVSGLGLAAAVTACGQEQADCAADGTVSTETFDPTRYLRTWNFSDLPADERAQFYRETPKSDGTTPPK